MSAMIKRQHSVVGAMGLVVHISVNPVIHSNNYTYIALVFPFSYEFLQVFPPPLPPPASLAATLWIVAHFLLGFCRESCVSTEDFKAQDETTGGTVQV